MIVIGIVIGVVITGVFMIAYLSDLSNLVDHISIHFSNGCIYNSDRLICSSE